VDALNDPAERKQMENLGLQMPPETPSPPAQPMPGDKADLA
jgi:hypothetical protein